MAGVPAVIVPDTVTATDLPLGGQRVLGIAVQVTLGGVCGTPFMLVIVMPPVPLPGSTSRSLEVVEIPRMFHCMCLSKSNRKAIETRCHPDKCRRAML